MLTLFKTAVRLSAPEYKILSSSHKPSCRQDT